MANTFEYDEKESRKTERSYLAPEVVRQRMRTLEALSARAGERIVDVGCGPGLLVRDLAVEVGPEGRVIGVDSSLPMLELAERRCADLPQAEFIEGNAEILPGDNATFDAATCTQVLLYIANIDKALEEIHRVLKPGGRIAIIETDWRGAVLNTTDAALTGKMFAAWDQTVPSPNLPVRLGPLLRQHGFTAVRVEAIPILSTSYLAEGWSVVMLNQFARLARESGMVSEAECQKWLDELERSSKEDAYFFCVNRFLFSAVKKVREVRPLGEDVRPGAL
ncbi:MAG: methyltransferase domain-containing protein [Lysobacterales bacterium]|nr:MAG: methyltransferase domain-containing protein [Xanthomonadales bacterium]